jgi:epoxyqueuosine reductase QueG
MGQALEAGLRAIAEEGMVDYFGVADLAVAEESIVEQGGEWLRPYDRAVVVGLRILDELVDRLPERERSAAVSFRHHCYDVINLRLDQVVSRLAGELQTKGHRVVPVPASKRFDDERICAVFSHKMAAHLAGLGWIGKSCLLITPDHGPRVRWASLLTDAPLEPTGEPMAPRCGRCMECVEICPVHAFKGRAFVASEPREARYDARRCEEHFDSMEARGDPSVCGLCVYACPHGRKGRNGPAEEMR